MVLPLTMSSTKSVVTLLSTRVKTAGLYSVTSTAVGLLAAFVISVTKRASTSAAAAS